MNPAGNASSSFLCLPSVSELQAKVVGVVALIDALYMDTAPSATFGNVLVPLPGRELQLGARLKF